MNIVILDAATLGNDIDLSTYFDAIGNLTTYDFTVPQDVVSRIEQADIVLTNKVVLNETNLAGNTSLKMIGILATGTNNIDLEYCKTRGIHVQNVAGYSTDSVAQHTFAMLFHLVHHNGYYDQYVKSGAYEKSPIFTHLAQSYWEIKDKKWGIIGLGTIGKRVAELATVFGATVNYYSTSGKNTDQVYQQVSLDQLMSESDVISIHAPLNENTKDLIDYDKMALMKPSAYLINVGRGGIVVENDLVNILNENRIAGVGLDVLEQEPIANNHPLLSIDNPSKLFITPHIAWASKEARRKLLSLTVMNIKQHFKIN